MRRENLMVAIAAFAMAGAGWLFTLAAWWCEADPWGLASSILSEKVGLPLAVMTLRHGCEGCVCIALMLLAAVLISENLEECESPRRFNIRA